jgi:hypothetical protein
VTLISKVQWSENATPSQKTQLFVRRRNRTITFGECKRTSRMYRNFCAAHKIRMHRKNSFTFALAPLKEESAKKSHNSEGVILRREYSLLPLSMWDLPRVFIDGVYHSRLPEESYVPFLVSFELERVRNEGFGYIQQLDWGIFCLRRHFIGSPNGSSFPFF